MKKLSVILTVLFLAMGMTAFSQGNPSEVIKQAFNQKFPGAKEMDWEIEENGWEVSFKLKDKEMSAEFDLVGNWMKTETELKKKDIPDAVKSTLRDKFPGYKVEKAEWEVTPDRQTYEIDLKKGKKEKEVTLDKKGKVLKVENGDEDED